MFDLKNYANNISNSIINKSLVKLRLLYLEEDKESIYYPHYFEYIGYPRLHNGKFKFTLLQRLIPKIINEKFDIEKEEINISDMETKLFESMKIEFDKDNQELIFSETSSNQINIDTILYTELNKIYFAKYDFIKITNRDNDEEYTGVLQNYDEEDIYMIDFDNNEIRISLDYNYKIEFYKPTYEEVFSSVDKIYNFINEINEDINIEIRSFYEMFPILKKFKFILFKTRNDAPKSCYVEMNFIAHATTGFIRPIKVDGKNYEGRYDFDQFKLFLERFITEYTKYADRENRLFEKET